MKRGIVRRGDITDHGGHPGKILEGSPNTLCNGRAVARLGDTGFCSHPDHAGNYPISSGSPNTFVNGRKIAREFDKLSCGATIVSASLNTFCN